MSREFGRDAAAGTVAARSSAAPALMGFRPAAILSSTKIPYPRGAKELGIEGSVVVQIHIGSDGSCGGAQLVQSSGFAELDDAALAAVRTWHYRPAVRGGMTIAGSIQHTVIFTHEGDNPR